MGLASSAPKKGEAFRVKLGERLEAYDLREARRLQVVHYEMRYKIAGHTLHSSALIPY